MSGFRPAGWLPGRHLQTIFGPLFRRRSKLPLVRERWELDDGDFVDVDQYGGDGREQTSAPVLLALHGLEGSSNAPYMRGLLEQARLRGLGALALNFRSCSGESNRLVRSYHSGETRDLDQVIRRVIARSPEAKILLCGFSLGGNVLVKWLGEEGAAVPPQIRGAVAISVPFDLALSARALDGPGPMARIYRRRFLHTLRRKALEKARRFPGSIHEGRLRAASSLIEFDELVTAPLHGFHSAADYYARSSSGPYLGRVRVPLLLLAAEDDPFIPPASLPVGAARENPLIRLEVSAGGGHVGFVAGSLLRPRYWAEERAIEFLADLAV